MTRIEAELEAKLKAIERKNRRCAAMQIAIWLLFIAVVLIFGK